MMAQCFKNCLLSSNLLSLLTYHFNRLRRVELKALENLVCFVYVLNRGREVVTFLKLGVPQLYRAHFALKTGRAHIGLYTYLVQKLPVPGHGGHIR